MNAHPTSCACVFCETNRAVIESAHDFDDACDCAACTIWRDTHCERCGAKYVSKMRTPADATCFECRYPVED